MSLIFLTLVLLASLVGSGYANSCHEMCKCENSDTMACPNIGFSRLPEGYWPRISNLYFQNNSIEVLFPYSLTGFPNLFELDLSRNRLRVLDFEMYSFPSALYALFLASNDISDILIPSKKEILNNLNYIDLGGNDITYLDPNILFDVAQNLNELIIDKNPLDICEGVPLLNHPQLEVLRIGGTNATNLGPETFFGVPKLIVIDLDGMGIQDPRGVLTNTRLQNVNLARNEISEFLPGTLPSGRIITLLNLSENPLVALDLAAINDAMAGTYHSVLDISGTPLACNCQYESLYWWGQGRGVTVQASCIGADCVFKKSPSNSSSNN